MNFQAWNIFIYAIVYLCCALAQTYTKWWWKSEFIEVVVICTLDMLNFWQQMPRTAKSFSLFMTYGQQHNMSTPCNNFPTKIFSKILSNNGVNESINKQMFMTFESVEIKQFKTFYYSHREWNKLKYSR